MRFRLLPYFFLFAIGFGHFAGAQITIQPITTRPCLLSGPEDVADIKARLVVHAHPVESLLSNYLYGSAAQKQTASTQFFTYPGTGDGNGLLQTYVGQKGRRLVEDLMRYDIAVSLGYATAGQQQQVLDLAVEFIHATFGTTAGNFPTLGANNGNLWLENVIALGLTALNFPDHADAQMWITQSVAYMDNEITAEFLDGAARETPRYHDWEMLHLSNYLTALKRRCGIDRYDSPVLRQALEWYVRFASPPLSVANNQPIIPAWGDATYTESLGRQFYAPALFAVAYKDRDPYFSQRLMYWWRRTGSANYADQAFDVTNPQILDPRLPDSPQAARTSFYAPTLGEAVLRVGSENADEMTATFICGHAGLSHENSDNGHIDLFAFGVPLALDSMSGPYDPDPTASTWNNHIFAHNTVRFQGQEPTGDETPNGTFNAFGSSDIADYVSGNTKYGTTSVRRVVFVKPDYLVVWDQCNASSYSDFWLHTPAQTLEWQDHKVVSHTPWNVDLDVDFLLPSGTLPLPTLAATNPTSDYTTRNTFASQVPAPTGPALYTTQGEGRFGEWTNPNDSSLGRNPFAFKRQTFFSVRAPTTSGHYLTVWHPRKVGVTPALTATLTSSTSTSVALSIDFNGRTDTITINTSGATVTKGGAGTVQFSETYPQSGVSGAARFVKSGYGSTTLASALTTTGAVEVTMGTVTLGASERIPNTAPLNLREGGTFDLGAFNETVGDLLLDGGTLTGTGTLNVANTEVWGGTLSAPVSGSGALHKKGAAPWTLSANLSYAGDTFIDGGTLSLNSTLPGTKNLQLAAGAVLDLNTALTLPNTSSLTWSGSITGTGTLVNNGTLQLVGTGTFGAGVSFTNNGTLDLSNWSGTLPPSFVNNGTVLARPTITTQPQSQTAAVAHNAQLTAAATGTGPLTYRWYLNGVALSDGGVISGATTTTLTLTGLTLANAGSYTFVATNPYGSATSAAAVLTLQGTTPAGTVVNDPFTDGDRTNTLGGDLWGLRWYQSAASGITFFDDSSGIGSGKALDVVPSATFSRAIAEFPTVSLLNSGDSVTLQFDIRFRSDPASATDSLRFGLYNTNGTSTSADGGSSNAGGSQTNRTDDFGYGVRTNVGGTSSGSRIFAQAAPGGSSGDLLSGTTTAMGSTAASSAFGHTSHPVALQITRNGDATLTVTATFDSNTFSGTTNGGSIPTLTYSFNEIGITNGSTSNEFLIDNVSVSTNATPNIAITSPTTGATFITLASSVALSGTAADHQGLTQVAWTNSAGGSGIATGSTSWSIASIPLVAGANVLTVSAQDADGNTATAVLTVTRLVPGNLQFSASAYQLNESAGAATISVTRTGGSDGAVSVGWATSNGTATAGVDYTAASGTLNWANGDSATKSFSIQLLAGTATSGDSTVNLALNTPTGSATLGSPASAALTIHHTPSDHWRFVHFGGNANNPALADDLVDPNGNGLVNLLEFALLGEPLGNSAGQSALPVAGRDATQHLTLSFMHSLERSDLTLTVEGSDAPGGPWMDLAQSAAGGSFVSLQQGVEVSESGPNDARAVMVSDLYTFGDPLHPQRFLRLEATH